MTEFERQIGFKFLLNEQKLSQQNIWWVHANDAYCPISQAWCVHCPTYKHNHKVSYKHSNWAGDNQSCLRIYHIFD